MPSNRPRAPTITVDTTNVGPPETNPQIALQPLSNPTSPQEAFPDPNLLNPSSAGNLLAVPTTSPTSLGSDTYLGSFSRGSIDAGRSSFGGDATTETLSPEDALHPDPGTEGDFQVDNNPFAFTPGQLGKLYNPKSLAALHALGGINGLQKGLRTDVEAGLNSGEQHFSDAVSFESATTVASVTENGEPAHK